MGIKYRIPRLIFKFIAEIIRCIDTNTIYPSISEASRQTKIPSSNICKCYKGERKIAGGYKWELI